MQSNSVELPFATLHFFIINDNDTLLILRNEMLHLNRVLPYRSIQNEILLYTENVNRLH